MPKIKLAAVEYLNTIPFIKSIERSSLFESVEFILDYPSRCAEHFRDRHVDLALVPVGALHEFSNYQIVTDYCIGCNGKVATVLLVSENPIQDLNTVFLDYQSRTSVRLIQILMRDYWRKNISFSRAEKGYEKEIKGGVGGLIIGDRAFNASGEFPFVYDLGECWKKLTGLPFVFAVWVCHAGLNSEVPFKLNEAFQLGLSDLDKMNIRFGGLGAKEIERYFSENIDYLFDEKKKLAMKKFLNYEIDL
nr:menaquinone biosynthesis protein [Saprospiraceae bacterium]